MRQNYDASREQLITILSADFTPEEERATMADPDASEFAKMVAQSRAQETISERIQSKECIDLYTRTLGALAMSVITEPFQDFIAGHVARAYTFKRAVDESVMPEQLGIIGGDGIFSPTEAKDIEARSLRGFLAWIIDGHVLTGTDDTAPSGKRSIITNPDEYELLIDGLDEWTLAYLFTYEEDAFGDTDPEMFFETARRIDIIPTGSQWSHILNRLKELHEGE